MLNISTPPPQALGIESDHVVDGRYRIVQQIADGGMGTVFLAEHVLIKRRFAVKFLHRELASDKEMVKRFMNEALAAGTLGHPHIVEATDMGFTPDSVPYIVFEYLEGVVLTEEIYRVGGMSVRRALRLARQIASALECAHNAGIVHLDLKSDNVYLTDKDGTQDHVKVLDFGISRFLEAEPDKTQRCLIAGTPEYMAPEQVQRPDQVDKRADVYALGVLLYEMLTARRPYGDEDPRALLYRICYESPAPLARPDVPDDLEALIFARMLAKDPAHRFQSMREVEDAIAPIHDRFSGRLSSAPPMGIDPVDDLRVTPPRGVALGTLPQPVAAEVAATQPAMIATPVPVSPSVVTAPEHRRRFAVGWSAAAVIATLAGGAAWMTQGRSGGDQRTARAARTALSAEASHLASTLEYQARTAQSRAEGLAMAPVLRAAIETDAATIQNLAADESLFIVNAGEQLEVFLLRGDAMASALRIPSNAPPLAPSDVVTTRVVSAEGGLAITATAPVTNQRAGVAGSLALSLPLELTGLGAQLAPYAIEATLVGFDRPIAIASTGTGTAARGERISVPVPLAAGLAARPISLEANLAPLRSGAANRTLAYLCFALVGVLVMIAGARTLRRTPQPG